MASHDSLSLVHLPVLLVFLFLCSKLYSAVMKSYTKPAKLMPTSSSTSKPIAAQGKPVIGNAPITNLAGEVEGSYVQYGRRYHSYHKGVYPFPCDETEAERLDVYHHVYHRARGERLFCAPIDTTKDFKVLDVGCGTGIWALGVSSQYETSMVSAMDLSALQPDGVTNRVRFHIPRDFEDPYWGVGENSFELVHIRGACGAVGHWLELYQKIKRHLKPGTGYIEHVEIDYQPRCDDGSLPEDPICKWYDYLKAATKRMHRPIEYQQNTHQLLIDAGYVDIKEQQVIKIPLNSWSKDPVEKEIGRWHILGMQDSIEAWSLKPFYEVNGWDERTVRGLVSDVKKHIVSRKIHAYNLMHIWTARRPEETPT